VARKLKTAQLIGERRSTPEAAPPKRSSDKNEEEVSARGRLKKDAFRLKGTCNIRMNAGLKEVTGREKEEKVVGRN